MIAVEERWISIEKTGIPQHGKDGENSSLRQFSDLL
jgi:hypothetical protein